VYWTFRNSVVVSKALSDLHTIVLSQDQRVYTSQAKHIQEVPAYWAHPTQR